jgi:hypothetical protein
MTFLALTACARSCEVEPSGPLVVLPEFSVGGSPSGSSRLR